MLSSLHTLFNCLSVSQKKRFIYLQFLIILMSLLEVASIALIGPYLSFIINDFNDSQLINILSNYINFEDKDELILNMGLIILGLIFISTVISVITTFLLALFSAKTGAEISDRLLKYYLEKDILYHDSKNTSIITKNLSTESLRMTDLVINPFMQMNAKIVLSIFILIFIFLINPIVATVGITSFLLTYLLIYQIVKGRLDTNGRHLTEVIANRFLLINESFGGVKETILLNKSSFYHSKYKKLGKLYSKTRGINHGISLAPRYLVEFISYGGIILSVIIFIIFYPNKLGQFVSLLTIYAIASLKLLPALQQIYTSVTQIRGNITSFLGLKEDLMSANKGINLVKKLEIKSFEDLKFVNVSFTYPNKDLPAIKNLSLEIFRNKNIAFVGSSGSGKSTLINLVLGLLQPCEGKIDINNTGIGFDLIKNRDSLVGYVPQDIYLTDKSIIENIAFGIDKPSIDLIKIKKAIRLAKLEEFINSFENGLHTLVGERGVQISGGQKQRIGIARALYNDPEILIFDEATSALDGDSEKLILESINSISQKKTIIMIAHRLNTVKKSDLIYVLEAGKIIEKGSYEFLMRESKNFKRMVDNN